MTLNDEPISGVSAVSWLIQFGVQASHQTVAKTSLMAVCEQKYSSDTDLVI